MKGQHTAKAFAACRMATPINSYSYAIPQQPYSEQLPVPKQMNIDWQYKHFDALSPHELYAILQLRNEVFVVEQQCIFQDADNKDQASYHLMGWNGTLLAAYARLVPAGVAYPECSIGRVVTSPKMRRTGAGRALMHKAIHLLYELWGKQNIRIGAQLYLKDFYESFGFQQTSAIYLEDGIEHIEMQLRIVS